MRPHERYFKPFMPAKNKFLAVKIVDARPHEKSRYHENFHHDFVVVNNNLDDSNHRLGTQLRSPAKTFIPLVHIEVKPSDKNESYFTSKFKEKCDHKPVLYLLEDLFDHVLFQYYSRPVCTCRNPDIASIYGIRTCTETIVCVEIRYMGREGKTYY